MEPFDYNNDRKFCTECNGYVPYLMSVEHSFCAHCGGRVRLFSKEDWQRFHEGLKERRPKGGRPRKNTTRRKNESA